LRERAGAYQVTVFTSPTPLRAGLVDVSVLVQEAATGACLPQARVNLRLTSRGTGDVLELPATTEAATNKLLRAAAFQLPHAGRWDVEDWPWFSWPAGAVALFAVHAMLARRRVGRRHGVPSSSIASI
jgi:hypothetical protein